MIGLCACKETLASSSPPTPSPASGGPSSSMTASSTPSPSSEDQTVISWVLIDCSLLHLEATPKTVMRVMGVKGLTLYHLKSHLQKFRLGKQHKEFNDHSVKDAMEMHRNAVSSSGMMGRSMNDVHMNEALRMQMEVQRRLHEQLEVQKHLQMRIEAQGKYMQSILEKAHQALASGDCGTWPGGYKSLGNHAVIDIGSSISFPSLQDLHLYGGRHLELQQQMERPMDSFLAFNESCIIGSVGKKSPSHYSSSTGKSPMVWAGEEQAKISADQLQMAPSMMMETGGIDVMDPTADVYEAKQIMSGDSMGSKGFESPSSKLEMRSSPQRAPVGSERIISPMVGAQARNLFYG